MQKAFEPVMDKAVGGHFIADEASAKAVWEFEVGIFGTEGRMSLS